MVYTKNALVGEHQGKMCENEKGRWMDGWMGGCMEVSRQEGDETQRVL